MNQGILSYLVFVKQSKLLVTEKYLTIILVLKGELTIHKLEREYTIHEGEITFINPNLPQYYDSKDGAYLLVTYIDLSKFHHIYDKIEYVEFLNRRLDKEYDEVTTNEINTALIDSLIGNFYHQNHKSYYISQSANSDSIVNMLFNNYKMINHITDKEDYYTNEMINRYYEIIKYIWEHVHEKIRVEDVLELVYINNAYFSQFMRRLVNMSFKEYVGYCKLMYILDQISSSDKSFIEIALEVGITDMKSFYGLFKKHLNMTPTAWKKLMENRKDDFIVIEDKEIFNEFVKRHHYDEYSENTISKVLKYLMICEVNRIDISEMELIVDLYKDYKGNQKKYLPYKGFYHMLDHFHKLNIKLVLSYSYDILKDPYHRTLLIGMLKDYAISLGITEMRNWRIVFTVRTSYEYEDAMKLKKEIKENIGNLHIVISNIYLIENI